MGASIGVLIIMGVTAALTVGLTTRDIRRSRP